MRRAFTLMEMSVFKLSNKFSGEKCFTRKNIKQNNYLEMYFISFFLNEVISHMAAVRQVQDIVNSE